MPTECKPTLFDFARRQGRAIVASFDGSRIASDAGALLLGATDRVIGLTRRLAACFADARNSTFVEHEVQTLVMQRVVGIALGYEALIDHDELRHDPVLAVLAGKSTLNRLELSRPEPSRNARLAADASAIETMYVDLVLDAHRKAPAQITLDLKATTIACEKCGLEVLPIEVNRQNSLAPCFGEHLYPSESADRSDGALGITLGPRTAARPTRPAGAGWCSGARPRGGRR